MTIRGAASAITLAFAVTLVGTSPATAHNSIVGSTPADGETVSNIPAITVYTNDELLDMGGAGGGFAIVVHDEAGLYYGDGCVDVMGSEASTHAALGGPGTYTVQYQVVSRDGHTISGEFSFEWAPAEDADQGPAYSNIPICGESQTPVGEETVEPTEAPSPGVPGPSTESEPDWLPVWIGLSTIPVLIGAIWLLIRLLGSRESEDHLS
ncbi:hypothetical protein C8A06_1268 [Microbacteriaceae bacterium MWH-Ta3]|nr:hypothetical protein C8A06_1268 [Microbacteriaceae bacterium MWH-Ta3]